MVCLTCDDDCIHIVVDNLVSLDQGHATQGCRNPKDLHVEKKPGTPPQNMRKRREIWDGTGKVLHKRTCVPRMVHEKKWFSSFYFSCYIWNFLFLTHMQLHWTQEPISYKEVRREEGTGMAVPVYISDTKSTRHIAGSTTRWGSSLIHYSVYAASLCLQCRPHR